MNPAESNRLARLLARLHAFERIILLPDQPVREGAEAPPEAADRDPVHRIGRGNHRRGSRVVAAARMVC